MSDLNKNIKEEPKSQDSQSTTRQSLENLSIKSEPTTNSKSAQSNQQQAPKRVFVPNLSIDRTKREVKTETDQKNSDNKNNKPRRPAVPNLNSSRGRGRQQQNLIQTHSVFEAGPAESTKRYGNKEDECVSRVVGNAGDLKGSSTIKKEPGQVAHENTIKLQDSYLIEDSKEDESPIYIKLNCDLKEEEVYDDKTRTNLKEISDEKDFEILKNIFIDENEKKDKILLFQIPENLRLDELDEGLVGKLKIKKSGKIYLCINDDKLLNVSLSVTSSFLQDACVLDINENNPETGTMTNLGHILNKLVCSPKI